MRACAVRSLDWQGQFRCLFDLSGLAIIKTYVRLAYFTYLLTSHKCVAVSYDARHQRIQHPSSSLEVAVGLEGPSRLPYFRDI